MAAISSKRGECLQPTACASDDEFIDHDLPSVMERLGRVVGFGQKSNFSDRVIFYLSLVLPALTMAAGGGPIRYISALMFVAVMFGSCVAVFQWWDCNYNGCVGRFASPTHAKQARRQYEHMCKNKMESKALNARSASNKNNNNHNDNNNDNNSQTLTKDSQRTLNPTRLAWKHALLFQLSMVNYWVQFLFALWTLLQHKLGFTEVLTEGRIVYVLLHTSLSVFCTVEQDNEGMKVRLKMENFASMIAQDSYESSCDIQVLVPVECGLTVENGDQPDVLESNQDAIQRTGRIIHFLVNDKAVTSLNDMFTFLWYHMAFCVHPMIHSYFDIHYQTREAVLEFEQTAPGKGYDHMYAHGQSLNYTADTGPGYLTFQRDWAQKTAVFNASRYMPVHGCSMARLGPYSQFARFLIHARAAVFACVKKHNVPVDAETFFLISVLHSVDHHSLGPMTQVHYLWFYEDQFKHANGWLNFLNSMFVVSNENVTSSNLLRDHTTDNPFFEDLYGRLTCIDRRMANWVTLSLIF